MIGILSNYWLNSKTPPEQQLLFGLLAMQLGYINREQLCDALSKVAVSVERDLQMILRDEETLSFNECRTLSDVCNTHLSRHSENIHQSISALPLADEVMSELAGSVPPELRAVVQRGQPTKMSSGSNQSTIRFQYIRSHKKGGLGEVFLASDAHIQRNVALKEILPEFAYDANSQSRFRIEAEVTGALEHPGIVPIYDLGEWDDGRPYYAMRFIRGRSLTEANKQSGERGRLLHSEDSQSSNRSQVTFSLLDLPPDAEGDWPKPIAPEAFRGVAGEFVSAILPETEADEAALLFHFLTFAGAMFGRERYFPIGGTAHHVRLFSVAVGATASGRKGTALDCVAYVFRLVDSLPDDPTSNGEHSAFNTENGFCDTNIVSGLVSGAGLIWNVRDASNDGTKSDSGVDDKRLLVIESELGGVLRKCQRKESDLSAVVRDAWDGKPLRSLGKQEPAMATDPHINLIGHITREQLRDTLSKVDTANGFANRILWYCAKRSKLLPRGGSLLSIDLSGIATSIRSALNYSRRRGRFTRSEAAEAIWETAYGRLTEPRPGIFGNVTTRAEAQTLRLSMLYALLDGTDVIDVQHLEAALAVWKYSEASARWAFGASLGNSTADELLSALRAVKPRGMTSTEVSGLFHRNRSKSQLREAYGILERYGLAFCKSDNTGKPGRPTLVYFAT